MEGKGGGLRSGPVVLVADGKVIAQVVNAGNDSLAARY
jgi:hypothetical protein